MGACINTEVARLTSVLELNLIGGEKSAYVRRWPSTLLEFPKDATVQMPLDDADRLPMV